MDCSPPGSSVHGTVQAKGLEWVAFPPPEDLPDPGTELASLASPVLAGRFFTTEPCGKIPPYNMLTSKNIFSSVQLISFPILMSPNSFLSDNHYSFLCIYVFVFVYSFILFLLVLLVFNILCMSEIIQYLSDLFHLP